MPAQSGGADFPFNGQATPANIAMRRYEYDPNNDGIVDEAASISDQTGMRIRNGYLQLLNTDTGTWHKITVSGQAGQETIDIGPAQN